MEKIHRGASTTASERILADLGDQAFLKLWSYPNLFIDKKKNSVGDGKELCDLLVVCGGDVIIFSDKMITWQSDKPMEVAWPRFYKRAVQESIDQILGASRWISQYPDRIFTDRACTQRLPITLPPNETRRTHGVVVAGGAYRACQQYTKDDSGSFMIVPPLRGEMHMDFKAPGFAPFSIGDPNPDGMFIHVFDDRTIKTVLRYLDTISDFTRYLNKRAEYIRSGQLLMAHGEEQLLGRYLTVGMLRGIHGFEAERKKKFRNHVSVTTQNEWRDYLFSNGHFAKTMANKISYSWDRVINLFTENIIDGTSVNVLGLAPDARLSEQGIRFMALEDRFSRRMLGQAVMEAMEKAEAQKAYRFTRVIMPTHGSANPKLAYVFLILAYPTDLEAAGGLPGGYEQYRRARSQILHAYCLVLLHEHRELEIAVGIAIDASFANTGRRGGSEDLIAIEAGPWTDELIADVAEAKKQFDILNTDRMAYFKASHDEYPIGRPSGTNSPA